MQNTQIQMQFREKHRKNCVQHFLQMQLQNIVEIQMKIHITNAQTNDNLNGLNIFLIDCVQQSVFCLHFVLQQQLYLDVQHDQGGQSQDNQGQDQNDQDQDQDDQFAKDQDQDY